MNYIFTPSHIQLLNSCYPPTSALLTAGPDYSPNSQELSRLTYFASNHPSKLNKLGSELEKHVRAESRRARAGNLRARATLLIALAILRALATECRRDIALLSPSLIASVEVSISSLPADLEVIARSASLFTAWTTYTDGHLIGTDRNLTKDYLSVLQNFATLSCQDGRDHEVRNRTRLIGFAVITAALNSEALYNDSTQFKGQVSVIMRPILYNMLQTELSTLEEQAGTVKDTPISPYLSEFRTRPTVERRAASIHLHVDGDKGPSMADVSSACLRALFSLLQHVNGSQLGYIVRSSFDNLEDLKGWKNVEHCCWFAQKTAEWAQYQYRYAVPSWLVDRMLEVEDTPETQSMQNALVTMVTSVLNSPIPLINLSTSDVITTLIRMVVRRVSANPDDALLPKLVGCISSLGSHIYYSEQIQDLAGEVINRVAGIELHGVLPRSNPLYLKTRSRALQTLIAGLLGLIRAADRSEALHSPPGQLRKRSGSITTRSIDAASRDAGINDRTSRRTRVPVDIWQDTLSLLCDSEYEVRADYAEALVFYLSSEMPRHSDHDDAESGKRPRRLESPIQQAMNINALLHAGDIGTKFLNAIHAYLYILAVSPSLGLTTANAPASPSRSTPNGHAHVEIPQLKLQPATPQGEVAGLDLPPPVSPVGSTNERRSFSISQPFRSRKTSVSYRLLEGTPSQVKASAEACLSDYAHIMQVLCVVHQEFPVRGLLTGIPMLLALHDAARQEESDDDLTLQRKNIVKSLLAKVWVVVGRTWDSADLIRMAEEAVTSTPSSAVLPVIQDRLPPLAIPEPEPSTQAWAGVDPQSALGVITTNGNVQEASALDAQTLLRRLSGGWSVHAALHDSHEKSTYDATIRGDGVSPLLKISPALMQIDNMSLQSLARSNRGVGVTDLREALEGRSSMSNTALTCAPSISTLEHASSEMGGDGRLPQTRSRTRSKSKKLAIRPGANQVGDVLNKLGIGKQNGSMLKASFPTPQRPDSRRNLPYKS